ncbi:amino acid kinase family protein, partial [Pseudonocardia saturnea]
TDTGALRLADAWGAASLTYLRDVPGILDGDTPLREVNAAELSRNLRQTGRSTRRRWRRCSGPSMSGRCR